MIHPISRLQRRKLRGARKTNEEKKQKQQERSGRVWRKLSEKAIAEQESQNEIRSAWAEARGQAGAS